MKSPLLTLFTPLTLLTFLTFLTPLTLPAQIQYQTSFNYSGTFVSLEDEGNKFYVMDVAAEQCRLYNPDFSLWKTINFNIPSNRYLSDIAYVSQYLFDGDPGVELLYVYYQYVQTNTSYYYVYTTCILDDDQSIMLEVPGSSWNELKSLDDGTRLLSYVYDYSIYPYTVQTRIYRLPGNFSGLPDAPPSGSLEFESVYPNPASSNLNLKIREPWNIEPASLIITDLNGSLILRQPVTRALEQIDLKSMGLSAGTYMIRLETTKLQTKFKKIVVTN